MANLENQNKKEVSKLLQVFSLTPSENIPKFVERTDKEFVSYGVDNLYPKFLIELAQSSALHGAIVKQVTQQISGAGVRVKDETPDSKLEAFIEKCNRQGESLTDVVNKIAFDYTLFGGFATSIVWSKGKTTYDLYHTDFSAVRSGKVDVTGQVNNYFFSSDWSKRNNTSYEVYPSFNAEDRTGTQVYYFKPYFPGNIYYPLPSYNVDVAALDAKIVQFHNSNIDNGFFPTVHIAYHNGIPSVEIQDENHDRIEEAFKGGSNAGKIIETYDNGGEQQTEIKPISNNDNDSKFTDLYNLILQAVLSSWNITSSELVGINQPGRLGNSNLQEAQELFFNTVIKPRQIAIQEELNYILKQTGFKGEIEIIPSQPISFSIPENLISKTMLIDEIRDKAGLEPLPNGEGKKIIDSNSSAAAQGNITPANNNTPLSNNNLLTENSNGN